MTTIVLCLSVVAIVGILAIAILGSIALTREKRTPKPTPTTPKPEKKGINWSNKVTTQRFVVIGAIALLIIAAAVIDPARAWPDHPKAWSIVVITTILAIGIGWFYPRLVTTLVVVLTCLFLINVLRPAGVGPDSKPVTGYGPEKFNWVVSYQVSPDEDKKTVVDLEKLTRVGDKGVRCVPTSDIWVEVTAKDPANPSGPPITFPPFLSSPTGGHVTPVIPYNATLHLRALGGKNATMTLKGV